MPVGFNCLSGVPAEIGACSNLRVLDLRNNRISELPDGICSLKLSLLDLTNNDLQKLPPRSVAWLNLYIYMCALGYSVFLFSVRFQGHVQVEYTQNPVSGM